jgi:hypothetical protein
MTSHLPSRGARLRIVLRKCYRYRYRTASQESTAPVEPVSGGAVEVSPLSHGVPVPLDVRMLTSCPRL